MGERPFLELELAEWLDALAGPRAAPGGGAAAAFAAATAAAVLAMAARVSKDEAAAARAAELRERTAPLAQRDAEAYGAARTSGDFAAAAGPPLAIARAAAEAADLAAGLVERGADVVRPDCLAAAALAAGAARAAAAIVAANVPGGGPAAEAEALARAAERSADRAFAA